MFALMRDFVLMFFLGVGVGYWIGWRHTKNHWKKRLALPPAKGSDPRGMLFFVKKRIAFRSDSNRH